MTWDVEYTDDFGLWWDALDVEEQNAIDVAVGLLEEKGPGLPFPLKFGDQEIAPRTHARTPDSAQGKAVSDSLCL